MKTSNQYSVVSKSEFGFPRSARVRRANALITGLLLTDSLIANHAL